MSNHNIDTIFMVTLVIMVGLCWLLSIWNVERIGKMTQELWRRLRRGWR